MGAHDWDESRTLMNRPPCGEGHSELKHIGMDRMRQIPGSVFLANAGRP